MKTIIDNNYIVNNFGYSVEGNLKNAKLGHMTYDKFLNMIYDSLCDHVIQNNININSEEELESKLDTEYKKTLYKRAQAIQAIFVLENGDNRFIYGETENIAPAVKTIIRDNLKLYQRKRILK